MHNQRERKGALSVASGIRVDLDRLEKCLATVGQTTLRDQATYLGIDPGQFSRLKAGKCGPSTVLISAVLNRFTAWKFEDFFEVVPRETEDAA